jgi:hypothetical protein
VTEVVTVLIAMEFFWWVGSVLLFFLWIAIAFWPARVAARKGHSFFLYFIFSLVCFPLALIVAYVVRDKRQIYRAAPV